MGFTPDNKIWLTTKASRGGGGSLAGTGCTQRSPAEPPGAADRRRALAARHWVWPLTRPARKARKHQPSVFECRVAGRRHLLCRLVGRGQVWPGEAAGEGPAELAARAELAPRCQALHTRACSRLHTWEGRARGTSMLPLLSCGCPWLRPNRNFSSFSTPTHTPPPHPTPPLCRPRSTPAALEFWTSSL